MEKKTRGVTTDSWLGRLQPEHRSRTDDAGTHGSTSGLRRPDSGGWDPYDVWLSRIERPRRRRQDLPVG